MSHFLESEYEGMGVTEPSGQRIIEMTATEYDALKAQLARYERLADEASLSKNDWDSIARLMDVEGWPAGAQQIRTLAAVVAALNEETPNG